MAQQNETSMAATNNRTKFWEGFVMGAGWTLAAAAVGGTIYLVKRLVARDKDESETEE